MKELICSPLEGKLISITDVDDDMFSKRMLGDGVAIISKKKELCSPIDGEVTMIYKTKHAIGLKTQAGRDILIHIGIDTVELMGKPFTMKVSIGDKVKQGDLLTIVDWKYIKKKKLDTVVTIVAIDAKIRVFSDLKKVKIGDPIFEIE